MKPKRIITIIIALLVLAGIFLVGSWYVSRKNAQKNGTDPLSFREFLGIGTTTAPGQDVGGEFGSDFTAQPGTTKPYDRNNNGINDWREDRNGNGTLDGDEDLNGNGIPDGLEDFDGNGINNNDEDPGRFGDNFGGPNMPGGDTLPPDDSGGRGGGGSPFDPGGSTGPGPGGDTLPPDDSGGPGGVDTPFDPGIPTGPTDGGSYTYCSTEDENIVFTKEELAQLGALQIQFNAIANRLYDTEAIDEQKDFYDKMKIRGTLLSKDLIPLFKDNAPGIIIKRVPTPFWHENSRDSETFTSYRRSIQTSDDRHTSNNRDVAGYVDSTTNNMASIFERLLRINIW